MVVRHIITSDSPIEDMNMNGLRVFQVQQLGILSTSPTIVGLLTPLFLKDNVSVVKGSFSARFAMILWQ
ncbi:hypothetical protein M404DRAFT_992654 [Pisolithus tinctorius Marx 270]|uniref:Uncharacterized protein n=1 Tax=Pisolithus tinctorius Marx 270 TaxID=870435 RepID=A0A0C3PYR1_PISTI|nr:hypothetical protein M404DRAFT_992654 [Pisolithus tinctorius Marx 270]